MASYQLLSGSSVGEAPITSPSHSAPFLIPRKPVPSRSNHQSQTSADLGSRDEQAPSIAPVEQLTSPASDDVETTKSVHAKTRVSSFTDRSKAPALWRSPWLQPVVLYGFLATFISLLIALICLFYFSERNHGLSIQISSNHYAWTYGPTALLVIVVGLWSQVDYQLRLLAPWQHMWQTQTSAERSLLLDYISPIFPLIIFQSIRNRDLSVAVSSLSLPLMRLIVVFSTGLFVLSPTTITDLNAVVSINSQLEGSQTPHQVQNLASLRYYGIYDRGMDYPFGTTESLAFDTVRLNNQEASTVLIAPVTAFVPNFRCEVATVSPNLEFIDYEVGGVTLTLTANLTTSFCPHLSNYMWWGLLCQPLQTSCQSSVVSGYMDPRISSDQNWFLQSNAYDDDPCSNLVGVLISDIRYGNFSYRNQSIPFLNAAVELAAISVLICQPTYSKENVNVTVDSTRADTRNGVRVEMPDSPSGDNLAGFSIYNLSSYLDVTLTDLTSSQEQIEFPIKQDNKDTGHLFDVFTAFMSMRRDYAPIAHFLDTSLLQETANMVLTAVISLTVALSMRYPNEDNVTGSMMYQENRLQIRPINFWAMMIGFILLMAMVGVLLLDKRDSGLPRDPNSILTQAVILSENENAQYLLRGSELCTDKELEHRLNRCTCTTMQKGSKFSFQVSRASRKAAEILVVRWWRPLSLRKLPIGLSILLPLVLIATLEILYRVSAGKDGLYSINPFSAIERSLPSILSTAILIVVAMLYESIDFATSTFAPYRKLHSGAVPAMPTLLNNTLGKHPVATFIRAVRHHQYALLLSSTAAILGSVLTILSSGLFFMDSMPALDSATVVALDRFETTSWNASISDNQAAIVFNLLEWANGSYPKFTYDEIALPTIKLKSQEEITHPAGKVIQLPLEVSLPALRANLECSVVPFENITINDTISTYEDETYWTLNVSMHAASPDGCHWLDPNQAWYPGINYWSQVLSIGPDQDVYYGMVNFLDPYHVNPPHCPSFGFFVGHFEFNVTSPSNVTWFTCIQTMETLQVDATFFTPEMRLDLTRPPRVKEHTISSRELKNFDVATVIWEYWDDLAGLNSWPDTRPEEKTVIMDWSHLFSTLLKGFGAIPVEELVGEANQDRLINATRHLYRKYMAQAINTNMRRTLSPAEVLNATSQFPATIQKSSELRLKVNQPSKIALQVTLGIMCLCATAVFVLSDMRHTLPHNPYTIAGVMTLLAGSDMCDPTKAILPPDAQYMTDKALEKAMQGWRFSLGWWNKIQYDETVRRFGIDVGRAEKAGRQDGSKSGRGLRIGGLWPIGRKKPSSKHPSDGETAADELDKGKKLQEK